LTNAILGEERVIVVKYQVQPEMRLIHHLKKIAKIMSCIDTAGIKKRGKIYENTDKYSVLRALLL
jgi:GTPase